MKHVIIYTDGSCSPNPGPGGWAAILRYGEREKEITGYEPRTTNNRMELRAALEALRALHQPCLVSLHTDSTYLEKAFNRGWVHRWRSNGFRTKAGEGVLNRDLWEGLLEETERHDVRWIKVKAHARNALNNRADRLAVEAMKSGAGA